jgi:hypothetical protein
MLQVRATGIEEEECEMYLWGVGSSGRLFQCGKYFVSC